MRFQVTLTSTQNCSINVTAIFCSDFKELYCKKVVNALKIVNSNSIKKNFGEGLFGPTLFLGWAGGGMPSPWLAEHPDSNSYARLCVLPFDLKQGRNYSRVSGTVPQRAAAAASIYMGTYYGRFWMLPPLWLLLAYAHVGPVLSSLGPCSPLNRKKGILLMIE